MNFDGTTIPPSIDLKDPAPDNVSDLGLPSILSANEIHKRISNFSEGYNDLSIKILADSIPKQIDDVKILYDVTQSGKIEDAGNKLYLNYLDLVKAVDTNLFGTIVQSNFDISYGIELCRDSRLQIEDEIATAQDLSDELLTEPRDTIYSLKYERAALAAIAELRQQYDKADLSSAIEAKKSELRHKFDMQYLEAVEEYDAKVAKKNKALNTLRSAQHHRERLHILEMVLKIFEAAGRQIISKIKDSVQHRYPALIPILKGTVILTSTNDTIHNPWDQNHLSGIGQILFDRFQKPSFVNFNNALIEALSVSLSPSDTKNDPLKAVHAVQQHIYSWQTRSLWDQMNPDLFWTAILLRSLHPSVPLRHDVVREVNRFIRQSEENPARNNSANDMPYFNFAIQYIQSNQDNRKFDSTTTSNPSHNFKSTENSIDSNPQRSTQNAKIGQNSNFSKFNHKSTKPDNVEMAAAASTSTTPTQKSLETVYNTPGKYFKDPVQRSKQIYFEHPSAKRIPYVAVPKLDDICSTCFNNGKPTATQCNPPCYSRHCTICNHYGHAKHWCLQSHNAKGVAV